MRPRPIHAGGQAGSCPHRFRRPPSVLSRPPWPRLPLIPSPSSHTHAHARALQLINYSGCGNTVNANHPVVKQLIIDSLVHWVEEYHVDGFRFDLASCLCRGGLGGGRVCSGRAGFLLLAAANSPTEMG